MAAYLIAGINRVSDQETFADYQRRATPTIEPYGGKVIAGAASEPVEGDWQPMVNLIIEFPTMSALKDWYDGDAYRVLRPMRQGSADVDIVAVEGV